MDFSSNDIKALMEFAAPVLAGVWYLRGILVKLDSTLDNLGGRVIKVEKDVDGLQGWRLEHVEHHSRST